MLNRKMALRVVDPYAEALVSLASGQGLLDTFTADVRFIAAVLQATPELGQFLASPLVKTEAKKNLLQQVFADQIHPLLLNALQLLTDRRRIMFLGALCQRFLELQRKLQNIVLAEVTAAVPLTEAQQQSIRERVKDFTQASSVELQISQDPTVLGGVILKIGSQVIDLSLRGQLRRLALQLA
ncbi:ATP synthase F1 subunit delta [Synechococcus sp. O70.2]|jgi:F-type H+-transporting ATPase subunit delta|uniref:ATP synthase F1 subunit delta n=1 Tax=unclassified Synechococcus TaxID=2626047 RepID=UPI0039C2B0E2